MLAQRLMLEMILRMNKKSKTNLQKMNKYFSLYACCIPVRGYKRSIICDLQRDSYMLIPNSLYEMLINGIFKVPYEEVINRFHEIKLDKWVKSIVEKEFGFFTDSVEELESFKQINLSHIEPKPITNAIIDFCPEYTHDVANIINQLSALFCEALEMRFFYKESVKNITSILFHTKDSSLRSVEVITEYSQEFDVSSIEKIFKENPRLLKLILHSASVDSIVDIEDGKKLVLYTKQKINSESHCGFVSSDFFSSNLSLFSEAMHKNSCLNKKMSIDKYGNIKNCPSLPNSFGNARNISLADALAEPTFTNLWNLTKDKITDCKVCEFRYICQDCRAYTTNGDLLSKPAKCNYNPYEAIWV